jgi:hypothetical protein
LTQEIFNLSIRKFLKTVGIISQREIERAVAAALGTDLIVRTESFPVRMTLEIDALKLKVVFEGAIDLG